MYGAAEVTSMNRTLHVFVMGVAASWALDAGAAVVNGDFTADLSGWTIDALARFGAPPITDPSPYITTTGYGGSPSVRFKTGSYDQGLVQASLSQEFAITAAAPVLGFDFTLPVVIPDATGSGASSDLDSFAVSITNYDLLIVDRNGPRVNPYSVPGPLHPTLSAASLPGYDYHLSVDLSPYVPLGRIFIAFYVSQTDDGEQFDPYLDNVTLSPVTKPVPLPGALALLALPLAALRRCRRV